MLSPAAADRSHSQARRRLIEAHKSDKVSARATFWNNAHKNSGVPIQLLDGRRLAVQVALVGTAAAVAQEDSLPPVFPPWRVVNGLKAVAAERIGQPRMLMYFENAEELARVAEQE